MRIYGQEFSPLIIDKIKQRVEKTPEISRRELSRCICEWMDWRAANGKYKEMSCRKALIKLQRQGIIDLPVQQKNSCFEKVASKNGRENMETPEIECELEGLGQIEVEMVASRHSKKSSIWNSLMDKYHPLRGGPLCGAQIRYLIWSSNYGYIGGLSFSAASFVVKKRDEYIRWSEGARRENLQRVVCNSRFLICPTVKVPNLASYVLGLCAKRLVQDWIERYNIEPVLMETYVDQEHHSGASYRAANWICAGKTSGRRGSVKAIYLYGLCSQWREELCREREIPLGESFRISDSQDWAEDEFGSAKIYDPRLKRRLFNLARDFYREPQAPIPEACGSTAETKAAYRFFANKRVTMERVLRGHIESTVERIKKHQVVLSVQDTTSLNYTTHEATEGLGPISTKDSKAMGLIVHDTMTFTEQGTPLGLLDVQLWARDSEDRGKKYKRKEKSIEEKESIKWLKSHQRACEVQKLCPETMIVSISDRESDIYELFLEAEKNPQGAKLMVRCERSRNRKAEEDFLWARMEKEPVSGFYGVRVPPKSSRPGREAKMQVRYAKVTLKPPRGKPYPPITVWLVYAKEFDYSPTVKSPLDWMLLTTAKVSSFEDAIQRLSWYTTRWNIEVYHKTLKSGCRIEDRRMEDAESLESCLAIDMVVAWRIYHLTKLSRELPDAPCSIFFEEAEWKALYIYVNKKVELPKKEPTLREATRKLASLGGFLGRKGDGEPGTITLWRGLVKLEVITATYILLVPHLRAGP